MVPTFDQFPCPALVTDRTGIVQSVNPSFLELVGGVEDSWLAKPMDLMFTVPSRIFLHTHVWPMLLRESRIREIYLQIVDGAGKRVPVFMNSQKTTTDTLECFSWVLFVSIERSRFEQELLAGKQRAEALTADLARTERFIRTVTNAVPGMIAYWDTSLRCQFANNSYVEWFGRTPQEMMGSSMATVLGEQFFEQNLPHIQGALAGTPQAFERATVKPDGTVGYGLAHYIPDSKPNGQVQGFFVLVTDITELRVLHERLRVKNEELKGFAYTVSHDLKAPLRGISGYAQELMRKHQDGLSERGQFCVDQIISASKNLDQLIDDLLKYSRLDAETPVARPVQLDALIQSILRDRSHTLAELGVVLSLEVPPQILTIWERGLHQVLSNLIDNAIKYSQHAKPPMLTIKAECANDFWQLSVADNGIGFDMKYHDRIFGLFNRLVRSTEFEGTGAGLAIVKKLIEKVGGSIRADSTPGQGSIFYLAIPCHPKQYQSV